jgi:branched-chain amino acid transport system ATP-binding protein
VRFAGESVAGRATEDIARLGVAHVPDGRGTFTDLTTEENLRLGAYARRNRSALAEDYERMYRLFPILAERRHQQAGTLSGGQQQMVSIARALLNDNRVLLVDEPTKGLAPKVVDEVAAALEQAARTVPIVLVEQNLQVVRRLAARAIVIAAGRVVHTGATADILDDAELTRRLLGVHADRAGDDAEQGVHR